jgi:lycopene cyclase domain-containing protein
MSSHFLYLLLDIGVIFFPFLLSFDKKVHYVGQWKHALVALFVIGLPFLIHDYCFTLMGVWGFNETYLTGPHLFNLPIEEVLFFVVVPFACTFIYACVRAYFPKANFKVFNHACYALMTVYGVLVLALGWGNWYSTMVALIVLPMILGLWYRHERYNFIPISFVLSVVPFFLMNSILTGAFTPEPVVWYNNAENLGFRWGTIPVEDILYSFILVVGNIWVFKRLLERERIGVAV